MATIKIDAALIQKMFIAGANNLESKKEWINDLNVFPVPDGDTGTNMTLTIMSAANEVSKIAEPTMENLSKAIATGSLRGARGNSGVILSQLFRGFTKEMSGVEELTVENLAIATKKATETAYKAVIKPKEGTILTVAKGISDKAAEIALDSDDVVEAVHDIIEYGKAVLAKTPEMLPVLKEAGVVDSGGQGLIVVLEGMYDALTGRVTDFTVKTGSSKETVSSSAKESAVPAGKGASIENVDIKYGYCTEFIIMLDKEFNEETEKKFKEFLSSIGDSIVCVVLDDIVKVHVHTNHPGQAFEKALTYGQLTRMKIDNMREEHNQKVIEQSEMQAAAEAEAAKKKAEPAKDFGFITISAGSGLSEIFKGLGVDEVIEGGQTMNPSTEDILNAVDNINAKTVFVLPNNKNIILAAQQAASLSEDKKVIVIPSKTIPQGITAMINFEAIRTAEENTDVMTEAMSTVVTGQLTYAVRDTSIDGKSISKNDIIGLGDNGLSAVGKSINDTLVSLVDDLMTDEGELISLYYGEGISEDDAQAAAKLIEDKYPDLDVELQYGGQPVYYYIVSVE